MMEKILRIIFITIAIIGLFALVLLFIAVFCVYILFNAIFDNSVPKELKNQIIANSTTYLHEKLDEEFKVTSVFQGHKMGNVVQGYLIRNPKVKFSLNTYGNVDHMFNTVNDLPNLHRRIISSDATDDWKPIMKRLFGDQDHFDIELKDVDINKLIRQDNKTELNYKYSDILPEYRIFRIGMRRFENLENEKTRVNEFRKAFHLIDYVKEKQLQVDEIVISYYKNKNDRTHTITVKHEDLKHIQSPDELNRYLVKLK